MAVELIVALDVDTKKEAKKMVNQLKDYVSIFKVGSQLFTAEGPKVLDMIAKKKKKAFLDLKYCDIPNTIINSVRMAQTHEVFALTLSMMAGKEMLEKVAKMTPRPLLWGVTVLTSMCGDDLERVGMSRSIESSIKNLAGLAKDIGLDGVICSPKEITIVRDIVGNNLKIITPGIRLEKIEGDDQKRVTTPKEVAEKGTDYIVVGRPIVKAEDPVKVARNILADLG
ncbi:orotidine-5'-phosphate decarboxylase [bacterium]|nr:orotidine-5'-phosphate decarboxylase [bacterium]